MTVMVCCEGSLLRSSNFWMIFLHTFRSYGAQHSCTVVFYKHSAPTELAVLTLMIYSNFKRLFFYKLVAPTELNILARSFLQTFRSSGAQYSWLNVVLQTFSSYGARRL